MPNINLSVNLCNIKLANPTVLASGILGTTKALLKRVAENGAGAVTIKSISFEPREGHKNPTVITFEAGMLNAVGYSNPGVNVAATEFSNLQDINAPVIASVIGTRKEDFARVVEGLSGSKFSAIEIPLSCPHTPGFGLLAGQGTPEATYAITSEVRKVTKLPIIVKLSPNIPELCTIAKAAEDAGANAITAVNSMGPGMIINIEAQKPVLSFMVGGVTGDALRPIAVRCVYDLYKAIKIPIIGVGGISTGRHAIEMMMAGASAVGIGTGVYYRGIDVFKKVCEEIIQWMQENGFDNINNIVGIAHD
ncbi:MAG: dihydroorotate dehydrogenase [Candidatus Brocadia sp. AMX2]|uniref:Dihydroorotate dehydrogenase n=1 Tax=Candidatus Brocadia sinica JPN1 TaxID=1197129 RepID=A0ABQ0K1Y9_9BACT|nr:MULTISPECIES: dihydroorotate dehydrogenase [Brocadia]KXK27692.1 MAG: dihydroorotate oxidase catalytic subunit [Candidatus Brocadia sinica]MBC6931520.1 dihydroorotate dehydrogenase [Candidatus Brocadia sp.]MBL1169160.1 dihydroorotate dehydrogenase [Candidatus Brocadia sp. AMX1]NOG42893.1 dihydroorotate dehydrogenase [Planctomycetota bacterium]MCE7866227.1 dihydroorotate dehydrogenase [Candidatus Brocadia sp. AMX2]